MAAAAMRRALPPTSTSFLRDRLLLTFSTKTAIPRSIGRHIAPTSLVFRIYALSCFTYAALAVYALARGFHGGMPRSGGSPSPPLYPGIRVEILLLFLQSACSFGCDAWTFGRASAWKPLDRTMASLFVLWQALKLAWLDMTAGEWACWCATLAAGMLCFMRGMRSLKSQQQPSPSGLVGGGGGSGAEGLAAAAATTRRRSARVANRATATGGGGNIVDESDSRGREEEENEEGARAIAVFLRWHTLWHLSLPLGAAVWMELRAFRVR